MALLRHGGMGRIFARAYAPSTLGSFLRAFTFGHVRQLDAVATRFLVALAGLTRLLGAPASPAATAAVQGADPGYALLDVDTIVEVHGHAKQGAGFGYPGVRGLNALLATVTTMTSAPVVVAQRLRKGSCGSPRGAARLVADALKTVNNLKPGRPTPKPLVRADSAFYGCATVGAALRGGAEVSVTVRLDQRVKTAISSIGDDTWTPIEYTDAVYDEQAGRWVSRAEVAEIPFTAFTSRTKAEQVAGRLVVRRIPDLNPAAIHGQATLFDTWRFHAFFTTTSTEHADTVAADKTHRGHAIIEQVHADLKKLRPGPPALRGVHRQRRLARAGRDRVQPDPRVRHAGRPRTGEGNHRDDPPQIDHRPRTDRVLRTQRVTLPTAWPWQTAWTRLFTRVCGPPPAPTT